MGNIPNVNAPIHGWIAQDTNANGKHSDLGHRLDVDLVGLRPRQKISALLGQLGVAVLSASNSRL